MDMENSDRWPTLRNCWRFWMTRLNDVAVRRLTSLQSSYWRCECNQENGPRGTFSSLGTALVTSSYKWVPITTRCPSWKHPYHIPNVEKQLLERLENASVDRERFEMRRFWLGWSQCSSHCIPMVTLLFLICPRYCLNLYYININ